MFGEPLWRKLERETRMKAAFPELNGTSPDEVMAIDADKTRRGAGTVTDFSQRVMQLARYASEEARKREEERNRTGAMPEGIDQGSRGQRPYSVSAPEKRPGVPRGVAEAFPETVQGGPVYDSGSSAPSINLTGSLLDNREGLPGPVKSALDVPVLGTVLTEAARPSNWISAAAAPLSFAPEAGFAARLGAEVAASAAGSLAGRVAEDKASGLPGPLPQIVGLGANVGTALLAGNAVSSAGGNPLKGFRQLTEGIPVGASVKDIGEGLPDDLAGGPAPSFADALEGLRSVVRTEARIRNRGIAEEEIRAGRSRQFSGVRSALDQAMERGLSGEELARQARAGASTGGLRRTVAEPLQLSQAQRDALFDEVMTRVADPKQDAGLYLTTTRALQKALDGEGLQPHEIRSLQPLLGHDMATALAGRAPVEEGNATGLVLRGATGAGPRLGGGITMPEQATRVPGTGRATKGIDPLVDPLAAQHRSSQIREGIKAFDKEQLRQLGPSEDDLMQRARDLLSGRQGSKLVDVGSAEDVALDLPGAPTVRKVRQELEETIDLWLRGNRELLDNMGPEGSQLISNINAQITGNVADSYLTAALARRNILAESLRATWGNVPDEAAAIQRDKIISRVTEALFQREIKIRYPQGVPERITELMKTTRPLPYQESLGAISTFNQRSKNSMFGILDVGVFGVQGLNAIRRGGVPLFAAMINRGLAAMHMPHVATMYADTMLPRQIQYGLDGVKQGAATGAFSKRQGSQEVGSLFQYLGPLGRAVDRPYIAAADRMSEWQFGSVLGGIRNAAYEGDLVMAHLLGQDITKASVRKAAAANANAIGSFAEGALRKSRAQKEGVAFLSAPMTRARVAQIAQMANLLKPTASPTERILAATTIISTVGYTLAVGKLLNDYIGVGDFEFMPDKPGFGQITTATGRVIDVVPQDSVERAFAKSIAAILQEDPQTAAEAWGNVAIGSAGPAPRIAAGAFGVGYEEGRGYRYGDMGGDLKGRVLNLAPIPPLVKSAAQDKLDPIGTPLDFVGVTNFEESAYAKAARVFEQETGGDWRKAAPAEQAAFKEQHPDIAAALEQSSIDRGGPQGELAAFRKQARTDQEGDDARVLSGEIGWDQWKDNRTRRMEQVRGFSTAVYGDQPIEKPKNAYEEWLNVVRENRTPDGVDWDAVDGWIAQQPEAAQQFIQDNTGLYGTKLEKERRAVADKLDETGYFDVSDKTWATVGKQSAFAKTVAGFDDYYGWYQSQINKLAGQMVKSGMPPGAATVEAERAMRTHPIVQAYAELKNVLESQWVAKVIKTDLPDQAMRMGYFKPTKEQSEMILTYPGARTAALP